MPVRLAKYQLLDFGKGRKLEQIGSVVLDRPCPGAMQPKKGSDLWDQVNVSYGLKKEDRWHYHNSWRPSDRTDGGGPETQPPWQCEHEGLRMSLKTTPAGQIGVFPEHWVHWPWLLEKLGGVQPDHPNEPLPKILSLFAYTGATTLALAKSGFAVTHVDASKPTVAWARLNCGLSGLEGRSIRWIVDDAVSFVKRELRRGVRYEAILLDPPTFGHGPQGTRWEIHRHLMPLLDDCWKLLSEARRAVLLCGHSSHIDIRQINGQLADEHGVESVGQCDITQASLIDSFGRKLDCGFAARYAFEK